MKNRGPGRLISIPKKKASAWSVANALSTRRVEGVAHKTVHVSLELVTQHIEMLNLTIFFLRHVMTW